MTLDYTVFEIEVDKGRLGGALSLLRALRDQPVSEKTVMKVRQDALRVAEGATRNAKQRSMSALLALAYGKRHPYACPAGGAVFSLKKLKPRSVWTHRRHAYHHGLLLILGPIDGEHLRTAVKTAFSRGSASNRSREARTSSLPLKGPRVLRRVQPPRLARARIDIAFVAMPQKHGRALEVLARILDDELLPALGQSSLGSSSLHAFAYAGSRGGLLAVRGRVTGSSVRDTLERILITIFTLRDPSQGILRRALQALRVQRALVAATTEGRGRLLASDIEGNLAGGLSLSSLRRAAREILRPERLSVVVTGPSLPPHGNLRQSIVAADRAATRSLTNHAGINHAGANHAGANHAGANHAGANHAGTVVLPNGARLMVQTRAGASLVALDLRWVGAGRRGESTRTAGVGRLLAAQMNRCNRGGALAWRARSGAEDFSLSATVLPGNEADLLARVSACVTNPPMEGLGAKRRMLLSTLNRDRPASRRARLFASLVYRAPGLREAQGGSWDGLGRVMGTEVVEYARRILRPKRLIIAAVGKVNRPVLAAAAMRFSCPRGATSIPEPGRDELASSPLDVVDPKAKASSASVGVGLGPMSRDDEMALICTADYLSAKPLVLPSGKQVTPHVSLRVGRVSGHLRLSAKTSQARMNVLVAIMRLRLRGLAHRGPPRAWITAWRRRWIAMWRA
ncbi:MAG: insulinase family protein, partial [Deltaproteobacteria bacterium]|nr:insulinase family protein [Deltaproteobacteria bacterium]